MESDSGLNAKATGSLLVILSGPSGVGKDAVLARLKQSHSPLKHVVTLTTRHPRLNEKDGEDYRFVSIANFEALLKGDMLLEHARVYGNSYGVPRKDVEDALAAGSDVLVKVDVQGATTIKAIMPQAVAIFLAPPSEDALFVRLKQRHTESGSELDVRLEAAKGEFDRRSLFDYVVVNEWDEIDRAVADIEAIIDGERCHARSLAHMGEATPEGI